MRLCEVKLVGVLPKYTDVVGDSVRYASLLCAAVVDRRCLPQQLLHRDIEHFCASVYEVLAFVLISGSRLITISGLGATAVLQCYIGVLCLSCFTRILRATLIT